MMAPIKQPGPVGHAKGRHDEIDDGTLARSRSEPPATVGAQGSGGQLQTAPTPLATGACAFLNPRSSGTVRAPQEAFDRLRNGSGTVTISAPRPKDSQAWLQGAPSAAIEQEITLDGQTIAVVRPTDADAAGKNLPTTAQVGEALRAVPANQRRHTSKVILSPRSHPDSTPSRTIAGEAMSHEITLFPVNSTQSQNDFDNRLMHEAGHNYHASFWFPEHLQEWRAAAAADNRLPSPYAAERTDEDFCEFNILYNTARGTTCEASARQLYPNRWAKRAAYQSP
jgi:hypothetical protein